MSFVTRTDIIAVIDGLMARLAKENSLAGELKPAAAANDLRRGMSRYGHDAPDLRSSWNWSTSPTGKEAEFRVFAIRPSAAIASAGMNGQGRGRGYFSRKDITADGADRREFRRPRTGLVPRSRRAARWPRDRQELQPRLLAKIARGCRPRRHLLVFVADKFEVNLQSALCLRKRSATRLEAPTPTR